MDSALEFIKDIAIFDLIVLVIIIYTMAQCAAKGFTSSLLSFSKWLISLLITIYSVPRLNPWLQNYIETNYYSDIGLGIFIFIVSLFVIINISRAISRKLKWSGLSNVDRTFGLIFGFFKGYLICVCIFTLVNWFYPYKKWSIETKDTISFERIYIYSRILIKKFPDSKDYYDETKEKIEDI